MVKDQDIAVVYLADCICMMMGIGVGSDGLAYRFDEKVIQQLGMDANEIPIIIAEFAINMQEVENLLNIV